MNSRSTQGSRIATHLLLFFCIEMCVMGEKLCQVGALSHPYKTDFSAKKNISFFPIICSFVSKIGFSGIW